MKHLSTLQVGSLDSLDQYDARLDFASPGSVGRLQALLDASLHGPDGSTHRRTGASRADGPGALAVAAAAGAAAAGAAAAAAAAQQGDAGGKGGSVYKDKSWNVPPPNFRFDFGGFEGKPKPKPDAGAEPKPEPKPQAPAEPRPHAPWPGMMAGAPMAVPSMTGPRGAAGLGERRMHGASLYRNMAVPHPPPQPHLATVRE
jgi:hypothetical protein